MAAAYRRRFAAELARAYLAPTLAEIRAAAGPVYGACATASEVVRAHCAHWADMLAPERRRALDTEVVRLRRRVDGVDAALLAYGALCADTPARALAWIDPAVLVVCVLRSVWLAANAGPLDEQACVAAAAAALKGVRDVVCALAGA